MNYLTYPEEIGGDQPSISRRGVAAAFFAGYAVAALSASAEPIHTDSEGLIVESVELSPADGFKLPAYIARPNRPGMFPAIVVASEIFGIHDYIKDVCRRLAKLGYVAIAPAFFVRVADPAPIADIGEVIKIVMKAPDAQVLGDVGAALRYIVGKSFVNADSIGITGFCFGGGVTWLACEEFDRIKAGVAWYGKMIAPTNGGADSNRLWPIERVSLLKAPVLGLYGGKDPLSNGVPAMRDALANAHRSDCEIVVYPDAGHGFHADYRPSFNADDAADGWSRMLAFFTAHGVGPPSARRT